MAIVGFQQAPGYPDGAGMFHMDDGSSMFAHDPQAASQFALPPMPPAEPPPMAMPQPLPQAQAPMQPNFSVPPPAQQQQLAALHVPDASPAGPPAPAPQVADVQPSLAPQMSPEDTNRAALNGLVVQRTKPHGAVAAGFDPKTKSETVETTAPPMSPEDIQQWGAGRAALLQTHRAEAVHQATQLEHESAQLQAQVPALQAQAARSRADLVKAEHAVNGDQAEYEQLMDEQKSKKVDPNRYFKNAGTLGQIGIIAGQAFGAYGAILGHGENYAQKMIDGLIHADIASQESDLDSGRKNVDNALKRLTLKFGDRDQAKAALFGAQQQAAATLRDSFAKGAQSQEIQDKNAIWEAQHQEETAKQARDFQTLSYGKHTAQISSQFHAAQAASAGGEIDWKKTMEAARGVGELQNVGALPDTSREGKKVEISRMKEERAQKANPAVLKAQEQLAAVNNSLQNAAELDKLYAGTGANGIIPGTLSRAQRGRMEYLQDIAPLEVHKGLTGLTRFTDTEGERYATAYGHHGETMDATGKHRAALGALREDLARKKAELEKSIGSGAGVSTEGAQDIKDVE